MIAGPRHDFQEVGHTAPLSLFTPSECRRILRALRAEAGAPPPDWPKALAVSSAACRAVATDPRVLDPVAELLGEDVLLWGASLVRRWPGQKHAWHVDLESTGVPGRTLTLWIGLEHTGPGSAPRVIARSHRLGKTVQEIAAHEERARVEASDEEVLGWARGLDPACEVVAPALRDGEALLLDGALWHASRCQNRLFARTALVLQYAVPDFPIRIPEELAFREWPFRFREVPRPVCILVRGEDRHGVNRLMPPTAPAPAPSAPDSGPRLTSVVRRLDVPLANAPDGWRRHPIFRGATPNAASLGCHASALGPGGTPHPPHEHAEEELLIPLAGEVELVLPEEGGGEVRHRLRPGTFVYYPAWRTHTIHNPGAQDVSYLMFRWRAQPVQREGRLGTRTVDLEWEGRAARDADAPAFAARPVLDGPTLHLRKLHAHLTRLRPGAGYEPHVDEHDVAIIVLEGTVETLGQEAGPHSVIFYAAGEPHGMRNPGPGPATYLVFELHGDDAGSARSGLRRFWAELRATPPRRVPGRLLRMAKGVARRLPLLRSVGRARRRGA